MYLIADSGSTKTDWKIVQNDGGILEFQTVGMNPFFTKISEVTEIAEKTFSTINTAEIQKIYFYGAGCINEEKCSTIISGLKPVFQNSAFEIFSDLTGAARALFGKDEGIAAILGTGCNSGYYDGEKIESNISPLGYILGDEGSGAYMGKKLIKGILRNEFSEEITSFFFNEYNLDKEKILDAVYRQAFPNRFLAQFSKFINKNISIPEIAEIPNNCFEDFISNMICKYKGCDILPLGIVGSVGFYFKEQLMQVCRNHNITIDKILLSPIDELVLFHEK
ncbi:MAG: hypothetical protein A2275_01515 [Bacteroidetes bacterium RIFOXYA12_FULL_35_11]|nr:MAG: hypothetical protein A2X01_19570 [Bacteroidetes bacterium GWF2_35_48]OFY75131.1 MAG: hypothetical protein A2275_01515 [Bacteroidetes bacterium RIFOXYA12_FULL_35_11]HBX50946.1 hypothetical protein [Bacteroidales bacterium]